MKKKIITRSLLAVFFALQLVSCSSEYVKMDAESCDCFTNDPLFEFDRETEKMKYNGGIFSGIVCEADKYHIEEITQYEEGKRTIVSEFEIDKGIDPWLSEYTEYKNDKRVKEIRFDWNGQIGGKIEYSPKTGKRIKETGYWINGEVKVIKEYDDEGKMVLSEEYYYNSNLKRKWDAATEKYIEYSSDGEKYEKNDELETLLQQEVEGDM